MVVLEKFFMVKTRTVKGFGQGTYHGLFRQIQWKITYALGGFAFFPVHIQDQKGNIVIWGYLGKCSFIETGEMKSSVKRVSQVIKSQKYGNWNPVTIIKNHECTNWMPIVATCYLGEVTVPG
jgi:hypothetical protein